MKPAGILLLLVLAAGICRASQQVPAPAQTRPVLLRGATIHPVTSPAAPGSILFENGRITAIGADIAAPADAEVIDVTGKHVYPSLISANTVLGLAEIGAVRATIDIAEPGAINPNVLSATSVNPDSELLPVTRSNGILIAHSVPEGGIISGKSAVIRLDGWTPQEMAIRAPAAMHLRWPNMTINRNPRAPKPVEVQQRDIERAVKTVHDAFEIARSYWQARKAGDPNLKSDLRWEAMMPVFEGQLPLFVHAQTLAQMEAALAWSRRAQQKIVLVGGNDAWRIAPQLKETDTPVIITLATSLPMRRDDPVDSAFANAARLHQAGVRFCIATGGRSSEAPHERNLPYEAAIAAAYGLPREEALKSLTLYPAQLLGVADQIGSLEMGKAATLIVTTGDPLDFPTRVEAAFIDGRPVDLTNRQTRLRDKYQQRYEQRR
jgi:imidazolonepropionase-like amidohydrolase